MHITHLSKPTNILSVMSHILILLHILKVLQNFHHNNVLSNNDSQKEYELSPRQPMIVQ